jgi:DNA polymerase-4
MELSDNVARKLRAAELATRTISIKVRFADFKTVTRSKTLANPTDTAQEIFRVAQSLLDAMNLQRIRVRLVGVRAENLVPGLDVPEQLQFGARISGWREAERVLDRVTAKFGKSMLRQARLISPESPESAESVDLSEEQD